MDLKFAFRALRRTPGFTVLSILILALGIGANTAIFSVVNAVVLKPLEYRDPDRLVSISTAWKHGGKYGLVSGPDFLDYRSGTTLFDSMAAYDSGPASVVANSQSEFTGIAEVSQGFLQTMGVEPVAGRVFTASDWNGKAAQVGLVGASFWERHFGNVPFTPGHTMKTGSSQVEIVGILPSGFHFPETAQTEAWLPFSEALKNTDRGGHNYRVVGRLKAGVTVQQAQAQLSAIAARLEKQYGSSNKDAGVNVTTLANFTVRNVKTSLYVLLSAVLLVLLIACANVANLLLARGTARIRELAIRSALGAGRLQLIRHLFVETLILALGGCVAGVLFAMAALPVLLRLAPKFVPRLEQVHVDTTALSFCILLSLVASFIFGVAPAMQARRVDPNNDLRGGTRGVRGGATGFLRQLFVTAEVALCLVLLVSAGLLLRSFSAMTSVDLGFQPQHLLVAQVSAPVKEDRANRTVYQPLLAKLSTEPGVLSVAITQTLPGDSDFRSDGAYIITGQTMKDFNVSSPQAGFSVVSPKYFETMGIRLVAGRSFSERDDMQAPPVAMISRSLARASFPRVDPIGQKLICGLDPYSINWMTIVGVVEDVRMDGPTRPAGAEIYMNYLQHPRTSGTLVVKTGPDPASVAGILRREVRALNPEISLKYGTMEEHLATVVSTPRFSSTLISVFAGLAILLAVIGIYAVMAYSVVQRTAEIGVRVALGADRSKVTGMILAQAFRLTAIGLVVGAVGAVAATRLLKSQLFGVSASDPSTYLATVFLLILVSLAASYLPAYRAARIEPIAALREE